MSVPVIDLGDVSDPTAAPGEYPPARHREVDRTVLRRLLTAAIAGVCVLMLGGSARPGPAILREMWSVPVTDNDTVSIQDGTVHMLRVGVGGSELTAYDLATGAARWTRPAGERPSWVQNVPQVGLLLLAGEEEWVEPEAGDEGVSPYVYGGAVTALDPATGATVWKRPGIQVSGGVEDTVLLYERDPAGVMTGLRLLNARDGSVVWERRPTGGVEAVQILLDGDRAARVVMAGPDGEVTVLRYADGGTVTSARVRWTPLAPDSGEGSMILTAPGLVMVVTQVEGRGSMVAYRADTLKPLWTRQFPDWGNAQQCGPVICVGGGDSFAGVDPETGEERWAIDGSLNFWLTLDGGLLLVSGNDDAPTQRIIDAATGRPTGHSARGEVLYQDDTGGLVLIRNIVPDTTRVAVRRLDLTTGRSVLIGSLPVADDHVCQGEGRHIACRSGGRLTVTAVG